MWSDLAAVQNWVVYAAFGSGSTHQTAVLYEAWIKDQTLRVKAAKAGEAVSPAKRLLLIKDGVNLQTAFDTNDRGEEGGKYVYWREREGEADRPY